MFDLYQTVTDQIIASLDAGVVPWRSPILGRSIASSPRNLSSGKAYRGVNVFLLAITQFSKGYESSTWLTFNQARDLGGSVRKGEKSAMVVFWKMLEKTEAGKEKKIPMLRYYNVFNACQCDGITPPDAPVFTPTPFTPIESAARLVAAYADAPTLTHEGSKAFYRPSADSVTMPEPTRFATNEEYYSTLFHELAHSTGHSKRLDRHLDNAAPTPFGSADYGKEELIAEMSAAFLSARAGISPTVIDNQAAYLGGWLKTIKSDKRLVVSAAGAAQKACDWIVGEKFEPEPTVAAE